MKRMLKQLLLMAGMAVLLAGMPAQACAEENNAA